MKYFTPVTIKFLDAMTANEVEEVKIDLDDFDTGASVSIHLNNLAHNLSESRLTYDVVAIGGYTGIMANALKDIVNVFHIYSAANAQPSQKTKINVGDYIIINTEESAINNARALGFSHKGIYNDETFLSSPLSYEETQLNTILTALNEHMAKKDISTEQLAEYYMNVIAKPFDSALIHRRVLQHNVEFFDIFWLTMQQGQYDKINHHYLMNIYYLTITDIMLHNYYGRHIKADSDLTRQQALDSAHAFLESFGWLPAL